ncbi:hypothetical protein TWF506_009620 [Arthrobotrys conoides]|uniref:Peptidase S8/S53 domain-containing protein n=1 Tax=Arthrobotrys conoides TaxID=74498 RepID=A0AAN8N786_9PEZI
MKSFGNIRLFRFFIYLLVFNIKWVIAPGKPYDDGPMEYEGDVEALGGDIKLWWFVPRTKYMKDEDFSREFHTELKKFAVKHGGSVEHVYRSHSDYLGTLYFSIKLSFLYDPDELWIAHRKNLLSYGEVPHTEHSKIQNHVDVKNAKAKAKPSTPSLLENLGKNVTLVTRATGPGFERVIDPKNVEVFEEPFEDLQKMSQPKGVPLSELRGQYYRRAAKGQGSTVYLIDTGAWVSETLKHKELSEIRLVDYLSAGPDPGTDIIDSWPAFYHGTKVLSRIAGRRLGTAPLADIVVVRSVNKFHYSSVAHVLDAILRVYDHLVRTKPKFAVLNISMNFPTGDLSGGYMTGNKDIIQKIHKKYDYPDASPKQEATGVLTTPEVVIKLTRYLVSEIEKLGNAKIVTCTNNDKNAPKGILPASEMIGYPKTVVVVGSTGLDDKSIYQYWDKVRVYAPSSNVMVATYDIDGSPTLLPEDGVSFATGTVSGMLATFVSEGVPIDDAVEHLYKLAHSRKPPNVKDPEGHYAPIAFNGVEEIEWPLTVGDQEGLEEYILP